MFQKILESKIISEKWIHALDGGGLVSAVEMDLFDEEINGIEVFESVTREFLRSLPDGLILKFFLRSEFANSIQEDQVRAQALKNIGFVQNRAFVVIEKPRDFKTDLFRFRREEIGSSVENFVKELGLQHFVNHGVSVRSLDAQDLLKIYPSLGEEIHHKFQSLDLGKEVLSILRLSKQSEFGIDVKALSHLKDSIPLPYTICCSIKPIPQVKAETLLRRKSKQSSLESDFKESRKFSEAQADLEQVALDGSRLFEFEWLCLLPRQSEELLRSEREDAKRALSGLGDVYIESVGAYNSFKSLFPGEIQHFTLIEKDDVVPCYLPLLSRGDKSADFQSKPRSLVVHRRDETLSSIDVFDPKYESFSWCVFGRPGTGKSVLVNAITRSLVNDPEIRVIKIDVGGSHSRETQMLGGVEKTLNLNEPTGINPFGILEILGPSKEALQILASFIEVLILEEGEVKIPKAMKADLERWIHFYAEDVKHNHCLQDFYNRIQDLPRRSLLQRWVGSGVYGNAFIPVAAGAFKEGSEKLTYFNFSKISQAQDPDYAQGGLAAVMAQFNFQMLQKAEHKKKIVFIADETPFFIQKCFSFFNLSIANIRKEGHGFITVAQKSAHVVVGGDTGILDNSPNKIFFSQDGDDQSFMARTQLSKSALETIQGLQRRSGEFSEAFLKDVKGERVIKLRLDHEEYWSYTSKDEDRRKFEELRRACPSLSLEEVIRCLSLS